jgi:membrane associated rhomboid family serine protease
MVASLEPDNRLEEDRFGTPAFFAAIGRAFVATCGVVAFLAAIEFIDERVGGRIDAFAGIQPRRPEGLVGVVLAPIVHTSFTHLLANSAPLILLGTFVLASGAKRFAIATAVITVCSGLGVWFLTPPNYLVLGASGVIFGWLGLLLMRSIVERSWWNLAVALMVGLLYGWQLGALLPSTEGVSWQGHLFGFLGGAFAAIFVRRPRPRPAPTAVGASVETDRVA